VRRDGLCHETKGLGFLGTADSGLDRGYASIHSSIVLIHRLHFEATNCRAYFDVFNSTSLTRAASERRPRAYLGACRNRGAGERPLLILNAQAYADTFIQLRWQRNAPLKFHLDFIDIAVMNT
jgi:hypothetical protein